MRPRIGIIGTGKVGNTLARLWFQKGFTIASVYNRTSENAVALAKHTHAAVANTIADVVEKSDIVFLTVPDDAIEPLVDDLRNLDWHGKAIVHTSGAASIDKLSALSETGAMLGSLHPAFPFADIETAMANITGASFAIETQDQQLQVWLEELVAALDGQVILIPEGKKAQYHAALVFASNYTVTLYAIAQDLLKKLGAGQIATDNALQVLLKATLTNIATQGIPDALTGPLTRVDLGTIQSHLESFDDNTITQAYITLARLSYPMLEQRGINTHSIEQLLQDHT